MLLDSSLHTLFHPSRPRNIFLKTTKRQKFAISIAPKGLNPCDSKIAEDVTTQIHNTEKTPVLHRHNWPIGIQKTPSVIPLVPHDVFLKFILIWTFLNVTPDIIWRAFCFSFVLCLIWPKLTLFPYFFCASNRHLSYSTN